MYRFSIAVVVSALVYYATNAISITLCIGICFYICIGGHNWIYLLFKTLPRDLKYVLKGIKMARKIKSFAKEGKTVADIFSDTTKVNPNKAAVPQEYIIGPLLFLLYVHGLKHVSKILKPIMFADDTNFFHAHKNIKSLFETVNK